MKDDVTLARWLNDEMDERELKEFMASPGFETYRKIREYSAQLEAPAFKHELAFDKIKAANKKPARIVKLNPWVGRIAAVLILALGAAFYLFTTHITTELAPNAATASFILPDNSSVQLNAGSTAAFKEWNWSSNRKLTLKGEAYFRVAKGKTFDVVTATGTVTVVGTQFNVKARGSRLDVTCFEGKVRVASGSHSIMLTPGESVAYENGAALKLPIVKDTQPRWINHEADFNAETLGGVVAELERQYNVDLKLKANRNKRFTGTIPTDDLDNALEILKIAYNLRIEKQGNTIILVDE